MTNVPKDGVCVRPNLGKPMTNTTSKDSSKDSETSNKGKSSSKDLSFPKDLSFSKPSTVYKKRTIAPKFNESAVCVRCKSNNITDESVCCQVCDVRFHGCCREKNGNSSSTAICTPSAFKLIMPLVKKYGKQNENRWGNYMFVCNTCSKKVLSLKGNHSKIPTESKDSSNYVDSETQTTGKDRFNYVDSETQTTDSTSEAVDISSADSETQTTDLIQNDDLLLFPGDHPSCMNTLRETTDTENSTFVASVSNLVTKNVETMMTDFKDDLLSRLDGLISNKLKSTLEIGSPYPLSSTHLRPRVPSTSSLSTVSLDDCPKVIDDNSLSSASFSSIELSDPLEKERNYQKALVGNLSHSVRKEIPSQKIVCNSPIPAPPSSEAPPSDLSASEHITVLKVDENAEVSLSEVEKLAGEALRTTPLTNLIPRPKGSKIVISFPTAEDREKGKKALEESTIVTTHKVSVNDAKKMFPKVTVTNIPNSIVSHITSDKTLPNVRESLKAFLETKFLEKNVDIEKMIASQNMTFKVVYVNSGSHYTTAGIRVSPGIRNYLIQNKKCIYIGYSKCNVFDRFDLKQCFRCQKIGTHISTQCKAPNASCKYCSQSHMTRGCPYKDEKQKHRCINCSNSTNIEFRNLCNTHHAGEESCPFIQQEKEKLISRTEYSKNM